MTQNIEIGNHWIRENLKVFVLPAQPKDLPSAWRVTLRTALKEASFQHRTLNQWIRSLRVRMFASPSTALLINKGNVRELTMAQKKLTQLKEAK